MEMSVQRVPDKRVTRPAPPVHDLPGLFVGIAVKDGVKHLYGLGWLEDEDIADQIADMIRLQAQERHREHQPKGRSPKKYRISLTKDSFAETFGVSKRKAKLMIEHLKKRGELSMVGDDIFEIDGPWW